MKSCSALIFGIEGYKYPKNLERPNKYFVGYKPENEKCKRGYIQTIIKHSKEIPDPVKYSKIIDWSKELHKSVMSKSKRLTLFAEI